VVAAVAGVGQGARAAQDRSGKHQKRPTRHDVSPAEEETCAGLSGKEVRAVLRTIQNNDGQE